MSRRYWYIKITNGTDPFVAESYIRIGGHFTGCPTTGGNICAIYAYGGDSLPLQAELDYGTHVNQYIQDAILSSSDQPVFDKFRVYVRL